MKVSFEYSKHKRLVDYPETKGFRHGKPVFQENFFGCLKKLEFDGECIREIVFWGDLMGLVFMLIEQIVVFG